MHWHTALVSLTLLLSHSVQSHLGSPSRCLDSRGLGQARQEVRERGSGASTGTLAEADYASLASDVGAAVAMLRKRSDIDPESIGLLGRSEGGWLAPMVAVRDRHIAFIQHV